MVTANGTVAPGASIGTLVTNGDFTFGPSSVFEVEFGGDPIQGDQLQVNGAVTIQDGATLQFVQLSDVGQGSFDFLTATDGVNGSFSTVDIPLFSLTEELAVSQTGTGTLTAEVRLADGSRLIADAPFNPVNGSPGSLLQQMSRNDFWAGVDDLSFLDGGPFLLDGRTEIGFDFQSFDQDGINIQLYSLPLRRRFPIQETDLTLLLEVPITVANIEGDLAYSGQAGVGLRAPVTDFWVLTPAVRVGGVYSDDFATEALGFGGSITSRIEIPFGDFLIDIGNHVGYYEANDIDVFVDESVAYSTSNTVLRNGVLVSGPLPMFGLELPAQVFAVDTRNYGDDLFVESHVEVGTSVNLTQLVGIPLRAGFTATLGDDTFGLSANTGYRF